MLLTMKNLEVFGYAVAAPQFSSVLSPRPAIRYCTFVALFSFVTFGNRPGHAEFFANSNVRSAFLDQVRARRRFTAPVRFPPTHPRFCYS